MQKLADGQDTEVRSSAAALWPGGVAAPQAGPARAGAVPVWLAAWELVPGPGGAGDRLHPVAAAASRMDSQAIASRGRPVSTVRPLRRGAGRLCPGVLT